MEEALRDFSRHTGLPVRLHEPVRGAVSLRNPDGTAEDFLTGLSAEGGLAWWFDGVTVHIEPTAKLTTVLLARPGIPADEVRRYLDALGVSSPKFPLKETHDGSVLRVAGPESFSNFVIDLIEKLGGRGLRSSAPGEALASSASLPRVYRGRRFAATPN